MPSPPVSVDDLLHLVDRAERGALLPGEAALLRAGIEQLAVLGERDGTHRRRRPLSSARLEAGFEHGRTMIAAS